MSVENIETHKASAVRDVRMAVRVSRWVQRGFISAAVATGIYAGTQDSHNPQLEHVIEPIFALGCVLAAGGVRFSMYDQIESTIADFADKTNAPYYLEAGTKRQELRMTEAYLETTGKMIPVEGMQSIEDELQDIRRASLVPLATYGSIGIALSMFTGEATHYNWPNWLLATFAAGAGVYAFRQTPHGEAVLREVESSSLERIGVIANGDMTKYFPPASSANG